MAELTMQNLLEAGTHFGHQTKRWNPKMKRYILCPRNGIYIIDLNKTITSLDSYIAKVKEEVRRGGKVLFVGTKKQIKDIIREEADRCSMPYVCERWLGGMLTNFQTIKQSIAKLEKIEKMEADGTIDALTKKERQILIKRKEKLVAVLSGIRNLRALPTIIFVVDVIKEHISVTEARRLRIPIGAMVDTNCDPDLVDFPIPGNDDAIKSVQLITGAIADAVLSVRPEVSEAEMASGSFSSDNGDEEVSEEGEDADALKQPKRRVVRRKMATPDEVEED
jgi:small subunit ribosomal protein S2